jgi:hypothetical protein
MLLSREMASSGDVLIASALAPQIAISMALFRDASVLGEAANNLDASSNAFFES